MRLLLLVLLASALPTLAHAQRDAALEPGDRIRISAPMAFRSAVVGTYLGGDATRVVLLEDTPQQDTLEVPRGLIVGMEVSRGYQAAEGDRIRDGVVQGLFSGLLVGGGVGVVRGYLKAQDEDEDVNIAAVAARTAAVLGVVGAGLGGIMGQSARERWERLPIPIPAMNLNMERAFALSVRVRF
jgi:hypothetical protein